MVESGSKISIGGDVGGSVVVGHNNVVGGASQASPPGRAPGAPAGLTPRMGFVLDVVGYGRRTAELKSDGQERVRALVGHLMADIGITERDADDDGGSGDGIAVFLPVGVDYSRVLP